MLKPQYRLRASADIAKTLRKGARIRILGCSLYVLDTSQDSRVPRFACIAGKRVHASAVVRHEVQRRLRAACARIAPMLPIPCDIVVIAEDGVLLTMDFQDLIRNIYYGILGIRA